MLNKVSTENPSIKYFKCNKIDHKISKWNIKRIGQPQLNKFKFQKKSYALTSMNPR